MRRGRAPATHLYPAELDDPTLLVAQPGEIEIPAFDEEALNRAARNGDALETPPREAAR